MIAKRDGVERASESDPEKDRHKAPIDWECSLGGQQYAFEHTLIEAFPKQLKHDVGALAIISPVSERLEGETPGDVSLALDIPIDATANLKRGDVPAIINVLVDYVKGKWKTLDAVPYGRRGNRFTNARGDEHLPRPGYIGMSG